MKLFTKEEITEGIRQNLLDMYCHALAARWKWVTADERLENGRGIISYALLTAGAAACAVTLHDGADASGKVIATLETTSNQSRPYALYEHILFDKGLYVEVDANTLGCLVVWHSIPSNITEL